MVCFHPISPAKQWLLWAHAAITAGSHSLPHLPPLSPVQGRLRYWALLHWHPSRGLLLCPVGLPQEAAIEATLQRVVDAVREEAAGAGLCSPQVRGGEREGSSGSSGRARPVARRSVSAAAVRREHACSSCPPTDRPAACPAGLMGAGPEVGAGRPPQQRVQLHEQPRPWLRLADHDNRWMGGRLLTSDDAARLRILDCCRRQGQGNSSRLLYGSGRGPGVRPWYGPSGECPGSAYGHHLCLG